MATEGERAHADAVINLCFEYIAGRCSATAHDSNVACEFSDAHAPALRVVTWNVNGLDQDNLRARAQHLLDLVARVAPMILCLQEVTAQFARFFEPALTAYYDVFDVRRTDRSLCLCYTSKLHLKKSGVWAASCFQLRHFT